MIEESGQSEPIDQGPHPVVILCTFLAWFCCSSVVALMAFASGWWIVLPAIALICLSFGVSLAVDVSRMDRWRRS